MAAGDTTPRAAPERVLTIRPEDAVSAPFPHVLSEEMIEPALFERLVAEFPADRHFEGKELGGRTGRDFYPGDPGFDAFMAESEAWRAFHDYIDSERFVRLVLDTFRPYLGEYGCAVDPDAARFAPHVETRSDLAAHGSLGRRIRRLFKDPRGRANELYTRFDIEQGGTSYAKPVHCDHHSRLASLVIYFADADEIGMEGGDLQLFRHRESKPPQRYERHPRPSDVELVTTIRPRANTGVLFLCSNNSYHGVTAVRKVDGYRRFVYLNVSSRADTIW